MADQKGERGSKRVLRVALAEDDDEQRDALQEALEQDGFEVMPFEDGSELIDYFEMLGTGVRGPDAIVTDIGMPGHSGLEAIEVARSHGSEAPAFIVTGSSDPEVRLRAARLGNALVILKPIDCDRLAEAIAQLARAHPRDD